MTARAGFRASLITALCLPALIAAQSACRPEDAGEERRCDPGRRRGPRRGDPSARRAGSGDLQPRLRNGWCCWSTTPPRAALLPSARLTHRIGTSRWTANGLSASDGKGAPSSTITRWRGREVPTASACRQRWDSFSSYRPAPAQFVQRPGCRRDAIIPGGRPAESRAPSFDLAEQQEVARVTVGRGAGSGVSAAAPIYR